MLRLFLSGIIISLGLLSSSTFAQDWSARYDSLMSSGAEYTNDDVFDFAYSHFEEAYTLAERYKDTTKMVRAGLEMGESLLSQQQYRSATNHFTLLDKNFSGASPPVTAALINNQVGYSYSFLGDHVNAVSYFERGIEFADLTNDSVQTSQLTRNMANSLMHLGEYERALIYSKRAIESTPKNFRIRLSRGYQTLYVNYLFLGLQEEAGPYILKSCSIAEEIGNKSLLNDCYFYLGDYYAQQNNLNSAITYYQKGLELAEEVNDLLNVARYYNFLGTTYLRLEEPIRALSYLNRALNYYESTENTLLAMELKVNIAKCFEEMGDFDTAEDLLLEALTFYTDGNSPYLEGTTNLALADLKILTGNEEEAVNYLRRSTEIGELNNNFWIRENALFRYLKLSDSLVSAQQKLALSKQIYSSAKRLNPERYLNASISLSRAFNTTGSDSAFYYAAQSFEGIEKKRRSFSGGSLKAGLFAEYAPYYNEVGSWYASEKKDYTRAFELVESAKARALLDELAEANEEELLKLSEATQIELLQLQKKVDQLYRQRETITDEAEFQRLTNDISDAQLQYDAKLEEIRRSHPAWNSYLYPETLSLKEVQGLCDSETVIIEYAFTDDLLMIFLVSKNQVVYHESPIDKKTLTQYINEFRDALIALEAPGVISEKSLPLYSVLIAPVESDLASFKNLVIVPDASLSLLPFEALISNERYLIQDYAIKYLPSVSVFNQIQSPHRTTTSPLLALASSGFETGDNLSGSSTQNSFAALPYTLIEVDSIAADFESSTVLKNQEVTEAALKSMNLGQYKYLHFATHGNIDEASPSQSGLILSRKQETEVLFGEDGYLNASEISRLKLNADMVVLSACNTAMGKVLSGEGLLGLQRSFLAAGSSSVVASLWSIYDRSTPVFMDSFYTKLIAYEEEEIGLFSKFLIWADLYEPDLVDYKTLALRDAKLEMLNHPYYSHPAHWAAFIITGK